MSFQTTYSHGGKPPPLLVASVLNFPGPVTSETWHRRLANITNSSSLRRSSFLRLFGTRLKHRLTPIDSGPTRWTN